MYAEARSWYESNIRPFKMTNIVDSDTRVLALNFGNPSNNSKPSTANQQNKSPSKPKPKKNKHHDTEDLPRDPNAWCDYHHFSGHSTEQCRGKFKDPEYIKFLESQKNPTSKSKSTAVRVHKISANNQTIWIYDTACTECMTDHPEYLHEYAEFEKSIPVYGVGNNILHTICKVVPFVLETICISYGN